MSKKENAKQKNDARAEKLFLLKEKLTELSCAPFVSKKVKVIAQNLVKKINS